MNGAWGSGADIGEIDFKKFTTNAKVEFHGCKTASGNSNIAANFSRKLYEAGKTRAVVIGHSTPANPNIDTKNPKKQDYRQGQRVVYHNGEVLFTTNKKGRITATEINKHLDEKLK